MTLCTLTMDMVTAPWGMLQAHPRAGGADPHMGCTLDPDKHVVQLKLPHLSDYAGDMLNLNPDPRESKESGESPWLLNSTFGHQHHCSWFTPGRAANTEDAE